MMLEYDWGNPAAAAAAMMLFGEETGNIGHDNGQENRQQVFDLYGHNNTLGMDFIQQPQPISATALFSNPSCHQRYGIALPPPSVQVPAPARIGLNLGVRTYFSAASEEAEMMLGRVCRRRTRTARCQAEGCGANLTHAKHYHRRHKVCEYHSKASIVITAGLAQRFCQQCSRFHVLSEFDQGKRSCRKRLADHNRRRRKSQDLTTSTQNNNSNSGGGGGGGNNNNNTSSADANNNINNDSMNPKKPSICSSVTSHVTSPPTPLAINNISSAPMGLGLGCGPIPATTGLSASSSTTTSPTPQSASFLSQLGEFRGPEHRFLSWDQEVDGSNIN